MSWHNRNAVFLAAPRPVVAALVAAADPGSSRLVYAMVGGLVLIGVALALLGVWLVRQTRPDLEVLAPLERMGDRDWRKRDPSTQRRILDEVRPEGAEPLRSEPGPPPIDADFGADHPVTSLSDLGPGVVVEQRDPTPIAAGSEFDLGDADESQDESQDGSLDESRTDGQGDEQQPEHEETQREHEDAPVGDPDDEALSDPRG